MLQVKLHQLQTLEYLQMVPHILKTCRLVDINYLRPLQQKSELPELHLFTITEIRTTQSRTQLMLRLLVEIQILTYLLEVEHTTNHETQLQVGDQMLI